MSGTRVRNDGGVGLLRLRRFAERFRQSLFFLPALFVMGSIVLGVVMVEIDQRITGQDLPAVLSTTVDNARSILSTVAGGTIGSASVVFSLTLVAVQLASSQFSPRVVRGFLGDRFQQMVMGIVVGTFTYSLVVLRVVQAPQDDGNSVPFLPQLSVLVAVILAVASLLAVLASIDHTAKSLRVGSLLDKITAETLEVIENRYIRLDDEDGQQTIHLDAPRAVPASPTVSEDIVEPEGEPLVLRSKRRGWITQISVAGLLEALPEDATIVLESAVGSYLLEGERLASVYPAADEKDREALEENLRDAIEVRSARTLQQDVSFGLLQLTDIALRALSPGVNDPNTANEAIVRIGAVLASLLQRDLESSHLSSDNRTIVRASDLSAHDYVQSAIEPVRRYARTEPEVLLTIIRTLRTVRETASSVCGAPVDVGSIDHQLEMLGASTDQLTTAEDRRRVRKALAQATAD